MKVLLPILFFVNLTAFGQQLYRITYDNWNIDIDRFDFDEMEFKDEDFLIFQDSTIINTKISGAEIKKHIREPDYYSHFNYNTRFSDDIIMVKNPPDSLMLPIWWKQATDRQVVYHIPTKRILNVNHPVNDICFENGVFYSLAYNDDFYLNNTKIDYEDGCDSEPLNFEMKYLKRVGDEIFLMVFEGEGLCPIKVFQFQKESKSFNCIFDSDIMNKMQHSNWNVFVYKSEPLLYPRYLNSFINIKKVETVWMQCYNQFTKIETRSDYDERPLIVNEMIFRGDSLIFQSIRENEYDLEESYLVEKNKKFYRVGIKLEGVRIYDQDIQIFQDVENCINIRYFVL